MPSMGIGVLGSPNTCFLRKFRWMIYLEENTFMGNESVHGSNILPPSRAARPNLSFKEIEAQHLNETIFFPGKPDWKPINITLYGIKKYPNPVYNYIKKIYNVNGEKYNYPIASNTTDSYIIPKVILEMFNGSGDVLERWVYEDCWFQNIDFGTDLDMSNSEVVMIELIMRYARAYIED
jgi:hypothetical protein